MERVDGLNMLVMLLPGAAVTYNVRTEFYISSKIILLQLTGAFVKSHPPAKASFPHRGENEVLKNTNIADTKFYRS